MRLKTHGTRRDCDGLGRSVAADFAESTSGRRACTYCGSDGLGREAGILFRSACVSLYVTDNCEKGGALVTTNKVHRGGRRRTGRLRGSASSIQKRHRKEASKDDNSLAIIYTHAHTKHVEEIKLKETLN